MKKKINLFRKKNGGLQNISITLPKKISEELGWYNTLKDLNILFDSKTKKVILSEIIESVSEVEILKNDEIIAFSKKVPIFITEKKYKDKIYITEKISIPIIIAKFLTNNFENLEINLKIENNNLILEESNE